MTPSPPTEEEKLMRKLTVRVFWVLAFLMAGYISGCGREQTSVLVPAVIATAPASGATGVFVNTVVSATFNEGMNGATITAATFTVTGPGVTPVPGIVSYAGGVATFTPAANLVNRTFYTATVTTGAQDAAGVGLATNYVWTFTATLTPPPTVISTFPANGAGTVPVNTLVSATFSEPMLGSSITPATFTLTGPGVTPVTGTVALVGNTATFTPATVLANSTQYTATITTGVRDATGHPLAADFPWMFTTAPPPTVVSTVPINGAVGVFVNSPVSATFSAAMNAATINAATFTLAGPGTTAVAGIITYAGTTATFTPAANLTNGTLYTATITTGAKDLTGAGLAANVVWTFTATNTPPPTVISTVPANGATGVAVNTLISATFSEAMLASTITGANFTVTGPGGIAVAGAVTYAGTTATFTPTLALANSSLYTATITTGVRDATGHPLATNYVWTFATGTLPAVTSTNPATAATNVPINQKITATFNEPMTAGTITAIGTFTVAVAGGGAAVTGTVTYDAASNSAIFTPTAALTTSTQYTATITTAAQAPGAHALASNYVWSFTTGLAPTAASPTIASTNPAGSATNVPLNQKIAATFSKAMDPATISAPGTFTVKVTTGGAAVPGSVAYDTASHTAVFTPASNFLASTQYTATISAAATDLAENALIAGSAPNPWSFTTGLAANAVAPTITVTSPANSAMNVQVNAAVSATFSAAMDPTTITNATFTLAVTGIGGASVPGTVAYNVASQIATFTPSANLVAGTSYTANVTNLVKDLTGNPLAAGPAPNPWTFTAVATVGLVGPNLGAASTFGTFGGGAGITNQGINTVINGDIGTTAVSTKVTGFHDAGPGCSYTETGSNVGVVNGLINTAPPPPTGVCLSEGTAATFAIATQAASDALAAYNSISPASLPGGTDPGAGQLGGLVLAPGVYKAASGSFMITGSDLTLDAQGNTNAVWVFQMASSLTVGGPGAPRNIILVNGAQAKNVFWQVGSAATINGAGGGTMVGTIIASAGVTFSTAGNAAITTLNGRALGLNASVTVVNTVVNVPAP
jgi:hypothetical protein